MAPFQRYVMRSQTLTHHAEQSARACAIMLGFAIPVSVALDNLLLAVTLGLWLVAADYRAKLATIGSNRVALAALALFALLAAGLAWGERESGAGMNMLGKYIDLAFVPIFATLFRTEEARRSAWNAFAAALALTLVLSYLTGGGILAGTRTRTRSSGSFSPHGHRRSAARSSPNGTGRGPSRPPARSPASPLTSRSRSTAVASSPPSRA